MTRIYGYIGRFFDYENSFADFYVTGASKLHIEGLDIFEVKQIESQNDMTAWHKKMKKFIENGGFYFSTSTDITSPFSEGITERYCWNCVALEQFEDSVGHVVNFPELRLFYGSIGIVPLLSAEELQKTLIVIHRRCSLRMGPRYTSRGICSTSGLAANFVESEQFILTIDKKEEKISISDLTTLYRGSPAVPWSQKATNLLSLHEEILPISQDATHIHFSRDFPPPLKVIHVVSLLSQKFQFQKELDEAQKKSIELLTIPSTVRQIFFVNNDILNTDVGKHDAYFLQLREFMKTEIIQKHNPKEWFADSHAWKFDPKKQSVHDDPWGSFLHLRTPLAGQSVTARVNCVDSTDRTHAGLACLFYEILMQDACEHHALLFNNARFLERFFESFGRTGDKIASQYCGSSLVRSEKFKGQSVDNLRDIRRSVHRYFMNRFFDGNKYCIMHMISQKLDEGRLGMEVEKDSSPLKNFLSRRSGRSRIALLACLWCLLWSLVAGLVNAFVIDLGFVGWFLLVVYLLYTIKDVFFPRKTREDGSQASQNRTHSWRFKPKKLIFPSAVLGLGVWQPWLFGFLFFGLVAFKVIDMIGIGDVLVDHRGQGSFCLPPKNPKQD
eukprot:GDKJ01051610.1.p1 GENE.GDKJ01051610.1~~GDKJ01051610.1.p1  ORF type:complete len:612 (-),score=111.49 GDKJ01051610.1:142-1977(-)